MSYTLNKSIYENMPLWIKSIICKIPFSVLAGTSYRKIIKRNAWFDSANRDEIINYQKIELHKMLTFAVNKIPAYSSYKKYVEKYQCNPFEALMAFPLLDKLTLNKDIERYLSFENKKYHKTYRTTTSGTSGNQLTLFVGDNSQSIETGFMHRQWKRVGYDTSCRKATFRGVSFNNLQENIFWQYNPIYNELQFSPFHMSEDNLLKYIKKIQEYKPDYIHGYPSAISILSEYIINNNISVNIPIIKAVLLGSEGLSDKQRALIENAFNTRAYSWYGHSERVILAGECEYNKTYHHFPDYGILEIIDENGNICNKEGERGEIVGTGLLNYTMPLIRYKTDDYATLLESKCECGRNWDRFTDVIDRWKHNALVGKNGVKISLGAVNMRGTLFEKVERYQYYQEYPGYCTLNIVVSKSFSEHERELLQKEYNKKFGDNIQFDVKIVENIQLTKRGKLKLLESKINLENMS